MFPQIAARNQPASSRTARNVTSPARPSGADADSSAQQIISYARYTEIFGANEPADYLYTVAKGTVRAYNVLNDGRRQIGGFFLPGDMFGLEFR